MSSHREETRSLARPLARCVATVEREDEAAEPPAASPDHSEIVPLQVPSQGVLVVRGKSLVISKSLRISLYTS